MPGGLLLIEVPHPVSASPGCWAAVVAVVPAQHQHYLSMDNLRDALESPADFDLVDVEIGPAHQAADLGGALWLLAQRLAPPPDLPWLEPPTRFDQVLRGVTLVLGGTVAGLGLAVDLAIAPIIRKRERLVERLPDHRPSPLLKARHPRRYGPATSSRPAARNAPEGARRLRRVRRRRGRGPPWGSRGRPRWMGITCTWAWGTSRPAMISPIRSPEGRALRLPDRGAPPA